MGDIRNKSEYNPYKPKPNT